ncbi:OmpA family protein [Endomicrobium proavitum]|uniref:OmpA-like domain-containing protein n=1 Tax=Endomicrobium proavitum TaxID=1408281 RepID=A0A0G3WJ43_9BACT|nr:OmpA family protein [Endomicrobium proavitum]AKL98348.1 exported protein of unknown function [Endomicrobium proavitum]
MKKLLILLAALCIYSDCFAITIGGINSFTDMQFVMQTYFSSASIILDKSILSTGDYGVVAYGDREVQGNNFMLSGNSQYAGFVVSSSATYLVIENLKMQDFNTALSGGALNLTAGITTIKDSLFVSNTAALKGGAIYVENSTLVFNTSSLTEFSQNSDIGGANAVYIGQNAIVQFDTIQNANVNMYDSVSSDLGTNGNLRITGLGNFNLYRTSLLAGTDIEIGGAGIVYGVLNLKDGSGLEAKSINNRQYGVFNMSDGYANVVRTGNFDSQGALKIDVFLNGTNDVVEASGNIDLSNGDLYVTLNQFMSDRFDRLDYKIISYAGSVAGLFGNVYFSSNTYNSYNIDVGVLNPNWITLSLFGAGRATNFLSFTKTRNEKEVSQAYDFLSQYTVTGTDLDNIINAIHIMNGSAARAALTAASGYFLPNVIRSAVSANDSKQIYDKIRISLRNSQQSDGVWAQLTGANKKFAEDENSPENFVSAETGVIAGYGKTLNDKDGVLGVFAKYNKQNISQGSNNADVSAVGAGGYFGLQKPTYELKAVISMGYDSFETHRYIDFAQRTANAKFGGFQIGADIQGDLKFKLSDVFEEIDDSVDLKPYAGLSAKSDFYQTIQETGAESLDLTVNGGAYTRIIARVGVEVGRVVGKWNWYANMEYNRFLSGAQPDINASFRGTNVGFNPVGTYEGGNIFELGAGANYMIFSNTYLFAKADMQTAARRYDIFGHLGVNYFFGGAANKSAKTINASSELDDIRARIQQLKVELERLRAREGQTTLRTELDSIKKQIAQIEAQLDALRKAEYERRPPREEILNKITVNEQANKDLAANYRRQDPQIRSYRLAMTNFKVGSSQLTFTAKGNIKYQAEYLKNTGYNKIVIEGHTDSSGNRNANIALSSKRAKAIYDEFIKNGIDKNKIGYIGMGEAMPIDTNKTAKGRMANRRAEVFIE